MLKIVKYVSLLVGAVASPCCSKAPDDALVNYIESNTGFMLECRDGEIRIQQPVEFLKIGSVNLSKNQFRAPNNKVVEVEGAVLPYFDLYPDRVAGPNKTHVYQKWSGSNNDLKWCVAYDPKDEVLWFALDYED